MIELTLKDLEEANINRIICQYGLCIIRGVEFDLQSFQVVSEKLGKTLKTERHVLNVDRTIQEISETGLFSNAKVEWHNDWSYGRGDYHGTMLYNVHNGGNAPTMFVDMSKLPAAFYEKYKDYIGFYAPPLDFQYCFTDKQAKILAKQKISRPFVFNHPITEEKVLYCSPGTLMQPHCDLSDIIKYANNNAYHHKWQKNDILIFDNFKMMHCRHEFAGLRTLWRVQFKLW